MCMVNGRNMMISLVELLKHCYTLHNMFEQKNIHLHRNTLQSLVYFHHSPHLCYLSCLVSTHGVYWKGYRTPAIYLKFPTQDGHHIDDLRVLCHWCHITFALGAKFLHLCCCGSLSTSTWKVVIIFFPRFWES